MLLSEEQSCMRKREHEKADGIAIKASFACGVCKVA